MKNARLREIRQRNGHLKNVIFCIIFILIFYYIYYIIIFLVPNTLIIHLKRFDNFMRKVKSFVRYPSELSLDNFIPDSQYELYSVLIHEGFSLNSGHYISTCL